MTAFDHLVSECRQAYDAFQHLASRTDDALYHALGQVHALRFRMHDDGALRTSFELLLQQHVSSKAVNETLFLVKYVFFPGTVRPGPGHKGDITKASRYAKLIDKALARNIRPADFVAFARAEKIQRISSITGRRRGRSRPHHRPQHRRLARSRVTAAACSATFLTALVKPLTAGFANAALGTRMADVRQRAGSQPLKLTVTLYLDQHRAVVTDLTGEPWVNQAPEAAIRLTQDRVVQASPPPRPAPGPESPRIPGSRLPPPPGRARGQVSGAHQWRPRMADGFVWPNLTGS